MTHQCPGPVQMSTTWRLQVLLLSISQNGGIVIASNDHSEQDMLSFLPLSDTVSASRSCVCTRGGVVTHLSFIAVNRKNITTTMGMEQMRWRAHLVKVGRELMILKLVKYDWGVDGNIVVVVHHFPLVHRANCWNLGSGRKGGYGAWKGEIVWIEG